MALEDAWFFLKGAPAPAWTRNVAESPKVITGGYQDPVAGFMGTAGHDGTRDKHGLRNIQHVDNQVQTNEALSNMRQGANVDLRQGQLDRAKKNLGSSRAAWRMNDIAYNALTPPRSFTRRALDRLTGRKQRGGDRMTEEEAVEGEVQDVDWKKRQLQAAQEGQYLGHRRYEDDQSPQPFSNTHQVQRMPAPDVGAESSFNTNPADATTSAFDPAPTWQGHEQPKQQQSWVPPTQ